MLSASSRLLKAQCLRDRQTWLAPHPTVAPPFRQHCSARRGGRTRAVQMAAASSAGPKEVWAFDFDGVVCDSVGESSLSAWRAAAVQWPDVFRTPEAEAQQERVVEGMRAVRPVVETGCAGHDGYENIVQVRCLLEGVPVEDILADWHGLLQEYMQRWQLDRSKLVELFGSARDEWIKEDLAGWLAPNCIYDGVPAVLNRLREQAELYIVTTKQARFTEALLRDMAKVPLDSDRIFSQTVSGQPKSEVLTMLQERHPGTQYHFIEDKMGTLEKVCKVPELEAWQLYLVDWGYNTPEERRRAEENPRIQLLSLGDSFAKATGTG